MALKIRKILDVMGSPSYRIRQDDPIESG